MGNTTEKTNSIYFIEVSYHCDYAVWQTFLWMFYSKQFGLEIYTFFFVYAVSRAIIHNKVDDRGHDHALVRAGQATFYGLKRIQGSLAPEYSPRGQSQSAQVDHGYE